LQLTSCTRTWRRLKRAKTKLLASEKNFDLCKREQESEVFWTMTYNVGKLCKYEEADCHDTTLEAYNTEDHELDD